MSQQTYTSEYNILLWPLSPSKCNLWLISDKFRCKWTETGLPEMHCECDLDILKNCIGDNSGWLLRDGNIYAPLIVCACLWGMHSIIQLFMMDYVLISQLFAKLNFFLSDPPSLASPVSSLSGRTSGKFVTHKYNTYICHQQQGMLIADNLPRALWMHSNYICRGLDTCTNSMKVPLTMLCLRFLFLQSYISPAGQSRLQLRWPLSLQPQ